MSTENLLVPIGHLAGRPSQIATSIDVSTPRGRLDAYNAIEGKALRAAGLIGSRLSVAHVLQHWVEIADQESGEVTRSLRTVLILSDGTLVEAVSGGIAQSIDRIAAILGPPPWDPPLTCIVKQRELGNARRMFFLEVCHETN